MAGTVLGKGTETINAYLARLKQLKMATGQLDQNGNAQQRDWQDYTPAALSYQKPTDNGYLASNSDQISKTDQAITSNALTQSANASNQALYQQQKALERQAKKSFTAPLTKQQVKSAAKGAGTPTLNTSSHSGATVPTNATTGGKAAPAAPAVGGGAPTPGAETTITSHGHTVTVNSSVAGRFQGFLDSLWSAGYHFSSVGGYANRDIHTGPAAGQGIQSLHAIGYAIDVDPTKNPTSPIRKSGGYVYALPPSVGALAAKYGLSWGGNWHSYKDFMHFSVPYGGRE